MPEQPKRPPDRTVLTLRYLTGVPREPLPPGQVVVHNHVRPQSQLGASGFRAWIATAGDEGVPSEYADRRYRVVRCECGWAPELADHYRVWRQVHDEG